MNKFFDIVIIGASKEGCLVSGQLSKLTVNKSIALISSRFPIQKPDAAECINGTVHYISYNRGLIGLTVDKHTSPTIFCTQLIISTGLKSTPLKCATYNSYNIHGIYYHVDELEPNIELKNCIVVGKTNKAIQMVYDLKQKFDKVYFCPNCFDFDKKAQRQINELEACENVHIFYGGELTEVTVNTQFHRQVCMAILDTDTLLYCNAIFVSLDQIPETQWIPATLFPKTEDGYLQITESCQSLRVPTIYACGDIVKKYTKTKRQAMIDTIVSQKIGG